MLGFINQSELPDYYVGADVLVLPSDGGDLGARGERGDGVWPAGRRVGHGRVLART